MMKNRKRSFGGSIYGLLVLSMFTLMHVGCNQEFENVLPPPFENDTLSTGDGSKRVLYIIMDGVKGAVVKNIAPTNLTQITSRAIYTYDGIADYQRNPLTQAAAWTTMLTGVDYTKNNVVSEDFAGFDNDVTPTLFTRLKAERKNAQTVSVTSSQDFLDKLALDADAKYKVTNDDEVKAAVIDELTNENPSLIVAQFNGPELAASGDYSETNSTYVAAINTLDNHIGEIIDALTARKTYGGENWLIVVASSKAGGPSGGAPGSNIYDDPSRNTYVAYYSPKFSSWPYAMPNVDALPYTGSGPRYQSNNSSINGIANQSNTSIGNFGTDDGFTLMFKMRDDVTGHNNYPMFVGKRNPSNTDVGGGGWSFLMGGGSFQVDWGGSPRPGGVVNLKDGQWHTLGFTIFREGGNRRLTVFCDGLPRNTVTINHSTDNEFPLRIGTDSRFNTNILIKDLVILNVALSESEMETYMRKEFSVDNPYFQDVIGWWPGNETSGNRLVDMSGNGNDFMFSSSIQFTSYNDISPNISPEISQSAFTAVPNGVDIPVMIYNWMNVSVPQEWGLMGKFYSPIVNLPKE